MRNKVRELQRDLYWAAKTNPGGTETKQDGKEYKILNSDDVLAVIE